MLLHEQLVVVRMLELFELFHRLLLRKQGSVLPPERSFVRRATGQPVVLGAKGVRHSAS